MITTAVSELPECLYSGAAPLGGADRTGILVNAPSMRRAAAVVAATAFLATLLPASPSSAADRCAVSVDLPSKVTIDRSYKEIKVVLKDPCKKVDWAGFPLYGPEGAEEYFSFDGTSTDYWDVYDWYTSVGALKTRDSVAFDRSYDELPVTEKTTTVKLGTKGTISSKRSGSKVTLDVTAKGYNLDASAFKSWNHPSATIQYASGSTWKTLKKVALKSGRGSYTYTQSSKRTYRLVLGETTRNWGTTSSSTTR